MALGEWEGTQPRVDNHSWVHSDFSSCALQHVCKGGKVGYSKENGALQIQPVMNLSSGWGGSALKSPLQSFGKRKAARLCHFAWQSPAMSGHMGYGLAVNCATNVVYF